MRMMTDKMRFGIVTDYYGVNTSLEKAFLHLAKSGIKDVEIPGNHLVEDISNPPSIRVFRKRLENINKLADDSGILIWQIHGPYGGNDLVADSEKTRKRNVDVYKRWLDICLELGAKSLIVHIGGRNDFCKNRDPKFIRDKNIDSLSQLIIHVSGGNLRIAIENLLSRCIENPSAFNIYGNRISDLKEMIKTLKSEIIGICLDTGHANIENLDIPLAIKEAGKHLIATHIQENNGIYDMHIFPFSLRQNFSGMDWFAIFKAFKEINYSYPLIGECGNSSGELPIWILDENLKYHKHLLDKILGKI